MEKKLLTVKEVCEQTGIGRDKVYELIREGVLPAVDLCGLKVRPRDLDDFINNLQTINHE